MTIATDMQSVAERKAAFLAVQRDHRTITAAVREHPEYSRSSVQRWRKEDKEFRRLHDAVLAGKATMLPDREPVDIATFVDDPRYLNKRASTRPVVRQALLDIYNGGEEPVTVLATGAIGTGKSFLHAIIVAYEIYRDSTLDDPQAAYDLDPDTSIIYAIQNRTESLALGNNFALLRSMLLGCRYFKECFPPIKKPSRNRIIFANNLQVWGESGDPASILGMNPRVFLADETDFMTETDDRPVTNAVYDAQQGGRHVMCFTARLRNEPDRQALIDHGIKDGLTYTDDPVVPDAGSGFVN